MFLPNDRWLTKNVKAEEESEKEGSSSSQQTPSSSPKRPSWSRKDDKEMDEMLGIGDHAPPHSPAHRVTNDNLMTIASHQPDFFDDEEDVSTLANDTVANETFFKNNRLSPPRQVRDPNVMFPEFATPDATKLRPNKFADGTSPANTAPETPPKDGDKSYYKDYEQGNRFSKRFWRVVTVAACLGAFLVAAVVVLGMNYYSIREERVASAEGTLGGLQSSSEGASDNGNEFQFDIRTGTPTTSVTNAPTRSPAPTVTFGPSNSPTLTPSIATPSPTTMGPSASPTETLSMQPTLTAYPTGNDPTIQPSTMPTGQPTTLAPSLEASAMPTGQPTTLTPTVMVTPEPTEAPTTPSPTKVPITAAPTENVPEKLIETLVNTPNFPLETMIEIEAKEQSSYAYQVVQWMARDPNLDSYSKEMVVQRFALGCLYKGLTKNMINNPMDTTWMTYTDICEWTVSSETLCDNKGLASSIYLENFGLEGKLVPEIGLLADSLTRLVITNNNIRGSLPTEMGFLTQLIRLRTHNNKMVGSLPTQLGNMRNMLSLRLGQNRYTGTIPVELANLALLETIHFPRNQLEGPLPEVLAEVDSLETIIVKDNLLTGEIPEAFSKMPNLESLELQNNDFTGQIKKKNFCKKLDVFIVDCAEVNCKCCGEENCCVDCNGRGF